MSFQDTDMYIPEDQITAVLRQNSESLNRLELTFDHLKVLMTSLKDTIENQLSRAQTIRGLSNRFGGCAVREYNRGQFILHLLPVIF